MSTKNRDSLSRRRFLATSAAGAATLAAPAILTASKTDTRPLVGEGDFQYECIHNWPELPSPFSWQTTHGVAVDSQGLLYVIHEGHADKQDHPSIFVFDPSGRLVRSFGNQFQGGGHGIEVRQEDGQEFLYVCAYQQVKSFAKLTLKGETVWEKHAPMQSGVYADGEATNPQKIWGRDRFMPTNYGFLPSGDFFLTDGYGSFYIHRYDKDGNWKSCCGGPGDGQGTFNTPHGMWVDDRPGRAPQLIVADRAHHTLQYLSLDGKYVETMEDFGFPANITTQGSLMMVPELFARVTILDVENHVVARLGDDSQRIIADKKHTIRRDPSQWKPGLFVHPHDACFDQQGNIFVAEWVATGRVTKLKRVV